MRWPTPWSSSPPAPPCARRCRCRRARRRPSAAGTARSCSCAAPTSVRSPPTWRSSGLPPSSTSDRPLRIADVAVWYGRQGGGITTYLDAKASFAESTKAFEHHVITPGRRDERHGNRHEVRARMQLANGYRIPLRTASLSHALRDAAPDLVLVHDRYWSLVAA